MSVCTCVHTRVPKVHFTSLTMCGKSYSSQATRTSHPGQSFSQKAPTSLNVTVGSHNQKSSEAVVWRPVLDFSQRGKRRAWCGGKGGPGMWEHPRPNHQGICTGRDYGAQGLRTCSLWPHVPGQGPETGQTLCCRPDPSAAASSITLTRY